MTCFLAIDVGTTALKAGLFEPEGNVLAVASQEYTLRTPAPTHVEMPTEFYWEALVAATKSVLGRASVSASQVAALAISSQGETFVALDGHGDPLRPAIVWLDNRAGKEAEVIEDQFDPASLFQATGQPEVVPTWPACKILWLREREPAIFARAKRYCLLEDYLVHRLTGEFVSEFSLLSSSLLLDIRERTWWQPMLDFLGISTDMLPALVNSGELVGKLSVEAARELGLTTETKVITGALDQAAGMLGAGNTKPGLITETTGTALAICTTIDEPVFNRDARIPCQCHALPDKYYLMPWGQTSGIVLKWFRDLFCEHERREAKETGRDPYDLIVALAENTPPGADGLIMLPHLAGAACPEFDPDARGVFFGLTLQHTKGHFVRAIMEAIAFMLRRNLESLEHLGLRVVEVRALGGAAKSRLWNQIKADALQMPVVTLVCPEAASLGAAVLAAVGAAHYDTIEQACEQMVRPGTRLEPDPSLRGVYDRVYGLYIDLYRAARPLFGRLRR